MQQKAGKKPFVFSSGRAHSVRFGFTKNIKNGLRYIKAVVEDGKPGNFEYTRCFKALKKSGNTYKFMDESATKFTLYVMGNVTIPEIVDMTKGSPCLK